ncbi:MAG: NUMOD4 domain-containing protein, partial [Vicingaceae bacterium]
NEDWKYIEGLESLYQISNVGTVKSLNRRVPHPKLKSQLVKGRILKQKVIINRNSIRFLPSHFVNKKSYFLF